MKIRFIPGSQNGKWSVWLIIAFAALFVLFQILVASGQRGGDTFFSNLALSVPMLIAAVCGILAFFAGIIGIIKDKERSIFVFIATIIGFFIILFVAGEFIFPH